MHQRCCSGSWLPFKCPYVLRVRLSQSNIFKMTQTQRSGFFGNTSPQWLVHRHITVSPTGASTKPPAASRASALIWLSSTKRCRHLFLEYPLCTEHHLFICVYDTPRHRAILWLVLAARIVGVPGKPNVAFCPLKFSKESQYGRATGFRQTVYTLGLPTGFLWCCG